MNNFIKSVAIVGGGGHIGSFITKELLNGGKHTITAIARKDSNSKFPEGVAVRRVDYNEPKTIVDALREQDALVITLSGFAEDGTQSKLIKAAAEAEVPWILPNEWSPDSKNEDLCKDVFVFPPKVAARQEIEKLGVSSYIGGLSFGPAFGIDIPSKTMTFFDKGDVKICTSTWPQVGRTIAAILSLPVNAEGSAPSLDKYKNQLVYMNSFTMSQKDMFESVLEVSGDSRDDWIIKKEGAKERFDAGAKEMSEGQRMGAAKVLYSRIFFPDTPGDVEHKGLLNDVLGLPKEDLNAATAVGIERSKMANIFG